MITSNFKQAEAALECKAAAVHSLLKPTYNLAFGFDINGVLGEGGYEEQKKNAYEWMLNYYEITGAVLFAAAELSEETYDGLFNLNSIPMKLEEAER